MKVLYVCLLIALCRIAWSSFEPMQVLCEVNGKMVPAIVDTGAEISVMSTSCARRCDLWDAIDTQHSGRAIGVGTSEIIGGIDGLGIRIGPVSFQNKISILRNSNHRCDFIIGLDILKRFNCDILLRERVIKMHVRGNEVRIPLITHVESQGSSTDLTGHFHSVSKQQQMKEASVNASPSPNVDAISNKLIHPANTNFLDEEEDEEFDEEEEDDQFTLEQHLQRGPPVPTASVATSTASSQSRRKEYVVNRHSYDKATYMNRIFSQSPVVQSRNELQSRSSYSDPDIEKYRGHTRSRAEQNQQSKADGSKASINTFDDEDDEFDGYDDDCDYLGENENYEQFQERHRDRGISMAGV